jgi:type IV pilus assembly protein PilX
MNQHQLQHRRTHKARGDRGFILVAGLLFLIVLTLLSLAMFRSFGLQERIAGNTRDKERAFEAAQSALQYGEWWLGQGNGIGTGVTCSGVINGNDLTAMKICSNANSTPAALPWSNRADYLPPNMTVASGGGLATSGDINYQAKPGMYINYLGLTPDGLAQLYQVTAFGYGGNSDTAAVVQSTYQVKSGVKDLGGL